MNATHHQSRRHIHHGDHTLQKWLLLALVVLEAVLVSLAIWTLYQALDTIIEEDMYRVHYSADTEVLSLLLKEGLVVLGWMLLVNVMALLAADRIWAIFVQDILKQLSHLMRASQDLDFASQHSNRSKHAVLAQAQSWRDTTRQRLQQSRSLILSLPPALPASAEARAELAARLRA